MNVAAVSDVPVLSMILDGGERVSASTSLASICRAVTQFSKALV